MEPLISVVIPVYNVEQYLNMCMQDVVQQTYRNLEIILVNDGSKDKSKELCDEWCERDSRVKVIHKANGGLSDARNCGIEASNGEWITFVDSDDRVSPVMLETLYRNAVETQSDISICDPEHIFEDKTWNFMTNNKRNVFGSLEAIEEMWYQKSFLVSAWAKLYKRSFFDSIRFKKGIIFEDVQVMHRVFEQAYNIVYSPSKLYGYVHRENSITTQEFSIKDCGILDICDELLDYAKRKNSSVYKAALAYYTVGCFRIYLNAPNEMLYHSYKERAIQGLDLYGKKTLHNKRVRKKTKLGILLYFYARFLLPIIYSRINRWR